MITLFTYGAYVGYSNANFCTTCVPLSSFNSGTICGDITDKKYSMSVGVDKKLIKCCNTRVPCGLAPMSKMCGERMNMI